MDRATLYAHEVNSGARLAGPGIRASAARHLYDLETQEERNIRYDEKEAAAAYTFFEQYLKLNGGQFEGLPFNLLPWQAFVVGSLFGWKSRDDGFRRFRMAYVETAKGSGKSPLAAGIGLKGLMADAEPRAEVYAGATKKDQAMILFRDAVAMVDLSPNLGSRLKKSGVGANVWNLTYAKNLSFFRPISADDGQSGPRPHMALIDEVHEHKTNNVIEMLRAGTKSRRQALVFMITNSGAGLTGPCWEYHEYGLRVASREIEDDSFFSYICGVDETDDPIKDEACWPKANPSLAEADLPGMKYIREQVTQARGMPAKEAIVRRLNFCQWTDAVSPWLSLDLWKNAAVPFDWREMRGAPAFAGLDLGSTNDLSALVLFVQWEGKTRIVPFAWTPEETLSDRSERDRVPYKAWIDAGHLFSTPGRAVSRLHVAQKLVEFDGFFDIRAIAYDRWRIEDLKAQASEAGLSLPADKLVPFGQGYSSMSPAVEHFEELFQANLIEHPNNPVLNWAMSSVTMDSDPAGNRKPTKAKSRGRIDAAVAAIMAAGVSTKAPEQKEYQMFVL